MQKAERRRLLQVIGTGAVSLVAGCSGFADDGGGDDPTTTSDDGSTDDGDQTDRATTDGGEETTTGATRDTSTVWSVPGRTAENRIYVPSEQGPGGELSRRWRWRLDPPDDVLVPEDEPWTNFWYSGVVSDGDRLYFLVTGSARLNESADRDKAYRSRLVAVDADTGTSTWQAELTVESGFPLLTRLTPSVVDGTAVVAGEEVQAIDVGGDPSWAVQTSRDVHGPPVAVDGQVYLPTQAGVKTYAVSDGSEGWTSSDRANLTDTVAVTEDTVYIPTWEEVVALDRADGSERWRRAATVESLGFDQDGRVPVGTPAVVGDSIYVASSSRSVDIEDNGVLVALERGSGAERWRFRPETPEAPASAEPVSGATVYGLPVVAEDTVFVAGATGDERLYVASRSDEAEYPTRHAVFAVSAGDGSLRWRTELPEPVTEVLGAGDTVYAVTNDRVVALAADDGRELGSAAVPLGARRRPMIADGALVLPTIEGVVAYEV